MESVVKYGSRWLAEADVKAFVVLFSQVLVLFAAVVGCQWSIHVLRELSPCDEKEKREIWGKIRGKEIEWEKEVEWERRESREVKYGSEAKGGNCDKKEKMKSLRQTKRKAWWGSNFSRWWDRMARMRWDRRLITAVLPIADSIRSNYHPRNSHTLSQLQKKEIYQTTRYDTSWRSVYVMPLAHKNRYW